MNDPTRALQRGVLLVALLICAPFSLATTFRQLSLEQMLDSTAIAFTGTVEAVRVEERDGVPWTVVEFSVERALAGQLDATTTLAFLGGDLAGAEQLQVNLMPSFTVGERVLILAYGEQYYSPVVGFNQGLWRLDGGELRDEQGRRLSLDAEGELLRDGSAGDSADVIDAVAAELEELQ